MENLKNIIELLLLISNILSSGDVTNCINPKFYTNIYVFTLLEDLRNLCDRRILLC